jgi:hypothetical protein
MNSSAIRNIPAGISSIQNMQRQASKPNHNGAVEPPATLARM